MHVLIDKILFSDCTQFCEEWASALVKKGSHSATACRQLIEVYKLKVQYIEKMNLEQFLRFHFL